MKKKFEYLERRGLPGGPNETFSYTTGVFSTEGYKRYSPDVNNPFNIIPSGNITMKDVDFPVEGTDNLGNSIMMKPGYDYKFPGNMVFERPIKEEKAVKPYGSINTFGNMAVAAGGLKSKNLDIEARYAKLLEQLGESKGSFNLGVNAKANKNNYQFNINPNITLSGDKPRIGINAGIKKTFRKGGGLLTKNMKCNNCGWSWRGVDGGKDATTCHKCGGSVLPKAQSGREQSRGETRRTAPTYITPEMTVQAFPNATPAQREALSTGPGNPMYRNAKTQLMFNKQPGNFANETADAFGYLVAGAPMEGLQTPQSLLVEGIEAARGNDYNFKNALPQYVSGDTNKQRLPSQTFLQNAPFPLQVAGDILIDPFAVAGVAKGGINAARYVKNFPKAFALNLDDVGIKAFKPNMNKGASFINESMNIRNLGKKINVTNDLLEEVKGEIFRGKKTRKEIEEGNKWLKEWINHPETVKKINKDLEGKYISEEVLNQILNYQPNSKLFPLKQQFKEYLDIIKTGEGTPMHLRNSGISYKHAISEEFRHIMDNLSKDPSLIKELPKWLQKRIQQNRVDSFISRKLSAKSKKSTTIHEGTHDWVSDDMLTKSGMKFDIYKQLNPKTKPVFEKWYKKNYQGIVPDNPLTKLENTIGYTANPTEVHARIMELRNHFNLTPKDKLTAKNAYSIINQMQKNPDIITNQKHFLNQIDKDPNKLAYLFNRLWGVAPLVGTGVAVSPYFFNPQEQVEYRNGGSLPKAQEGKQLPTYMLPEVEVKGYSNAAPHQLEILRSPYASEGAKAAVRNELKSGIPFMESTKRAALMPFKFMGNMAAEASGVPSAYRIGKQIKKEGVGSVAKDVGLTLESVLLGTNPYSNIIPSPKEDYSGLGTTMDVATFLPYIGAAGRGVKRLGTAGLNNYSKSFALNLDDVGRQAFKPSLSPKPLSGSTKAASSIDNVSSGLTNTPQPWQMQELPGLHLKSTMFDNPKGLHKYVAKDGSIDTKSALDHLKRMEGDAKYEVVLENLKDKYGVNLENLPKRMDYNNLRKDIQESLWDIGTGKGQQVDRYAGMDMKEFGIVKKDKGISLGYNPDEINLTGYSFSNRNKFIGGSDAHNMPKETLGHSRGFTNPNEPGVYYSAERQSNWAQEAGSTLKKTDIELLKRQENLFLKGIKEQEDLIAAGNNTWAVTQKNTFENQLKNVQSKVDSYNRYVKASPQEKLVMKNMNQRMLQEDVAHAASQGHTKYRLPSEESMAKIQGFSKEKILTPEAIAKKNELIEKQNKIFAEFQKGRKDKVTEDLYLKQYDDLNLEIKKINETATLGDYSPAQKTILKHTNQSLKDAEKLFDVKLKPVTDSKGNIWYEFDIPDKFKKGKGEIKAFGLGGVVGSQYFSNPQEQVEYRNGGALPRAQEGKTIIPNIYQDDEDFQAQLNLYNEKMKLYNASKSWYDYLKNNTVGKTTLSAEDIKIFNDINSSIKDTLPHIKPYKTEKVNAGIVYWFDKPTPPQRPQIPIETIQTKGIADLLLQRPQIEKVPEEKVPYKKEPAWYQRTGFNSQPVRIQPSNYDPDAPYWRGEPFQKEYQAGGQLPKAQDGLGLSNLYNKAKNLITESEELDYAKRLVNTLPQYLNPKTYSYSSEEGLDLIPNYNKYNNFGEAFNQAREDLGRGQTFLYDGVRHTTNKENEFPNDESETVFNTMTEILTPEQKNKAKEYYFKQGAPYLSLGIDDNKFAILPNAQISFSDLSKDYPDRPHVNPVGPYNKVYLNNDYYGDVHLLVEELAHIEQVRDKGTVPFFGHLLFDELKGKLQKKSPYYMEGAIEHSAHEVIGPKRLKEIWGYQNGGQLLKVQDGNGEYTVQAGNTFDGIANLKEVPKDLLRKANPDIDYNNIKVGQVINIPDAPKTKEERMEFSSGRKREDLTENILSANKLENYLAESRGNTPEFWKATADTIAYHESGPWQRMDPKAIQRSQDKGTGEIFQGPGEGLFQIETDRAGGSNSFSTFKNRYVNIAEALGMDADPEIMNAKRPIDLPAEKQYTLFYSNLIESPDVKLKDYVDGKLSLEDLWLKGHKIKETKGDRENFQESVQNARKKGIPFTQIGEETSDLEIYKNYINGLYDGTEMEAAAQRLYDKLNRVYYRKAKGLGMSVPNYIMTNIINRTN